MSFNMDGYVDVAERVAAFADKHKEGSLQSTLEFLPEAGGWLCTAYAYRTPDDPRPGVGHAFEPVPGKTPYTKDSEAMNAETSAWGRAIVALGFPTKKIASAQEVQARVAVGDSAGANTGTVGAAAPVGGAPVAPGYDPNTETPAAEVVIHFSKNKGRKLGELSMKQLEWYANTWEPNPQYESEADRVLKAAALALIGAEPAPANDMDDIPF